MTYRLRKLLPKPQTLIGTDLLWILVILAGFLFFTSLIPLAPNDYWWHLRIGEIIASEKAIPTTNRYGWTIPEEQPFFYAAWLGEWLFYVIHQIGGLSLVTFIRTLLAGISFFLVAYEARCRSRSWRIAALPLALAGLMSTNNLLVRTQMWAWVPFILTYLSLSHYATTRSHKLWLLLPPLCMLFWVNIHGSFILGLVLCGIYLTGGLISRLLKLNQAMSWSQLSWLAGSSALTGMAILANPRFSGILIYVSNLLSNQPVQKFIQEWQSPTPHGLAPVTFYASILILIAATAYSRHRLSLTDLLLVLSFLWLAWSGIRSITWFAMIVMPILASLISELPVPRLSLPTQKNWLNLVITIFLLIPVIAAQPWFVLSLPLPANYWNQVQNDPGVGYLLDWHTPVEAARYLQNHPGGPLFNELGYGSYLIWAVPDQPVFIDPRIELYPIEIWEDYTHISNGVRSLELLEKYQVERVLLDLAYQPELSVILQQSPDWKLEYADEHAQLWALNR
jgi:hypothetical protein